MNPLTLFVDHLLDAREDWERQRAVTGVEPERTLAVILADWLAVIINAVADALTALARRARLRRIHTAYHRRHRYR